MTRRNVPEKRVRLMQDMLQDDLDRSIFKRRCAVQTMKAADSMWMYGCTNDLP